MKIILYTLSAIFILTACDGIKSDIENVSYKSDVQTIFNASCIQGACHNFTYNSGGINLETYQSMMSSISMNTGDLIINIGNANNSLLYDVLTTNDISRLMPKNQSNLSVGKTDTIYVWINEGALNN